MDNTVESMMLEQPQDDAAITETSEDTQTLSDILGEAEQSSQPEQGEAEKAEPQQQKAQTEPGWIAKRVNAAVEKATRAAESRIRAEYEQQLAPLREAQREREAEKLVADGKIADKALALEYLRLKGGEPAQIDSEAEKPAARDAHGRFAARETNPADTQPPVEIAQRAEKLYAQAQTIKSLNGVDVLEIFNSDPEVKLRVSSGEWDFLDVAKAAQDKASGRIPAPVRSANGVALGGANIARMSDKQFSKLDEMLARGDKINMRE